MAKTLKFGRMPTIFMEDKTKKFAPMENTGDKAKTRAQLADLRATNTATGTPGTSRKYARKPAI
jgi:hypothetical protein